MRVGGPDLYFCYTTARMLKDDRKRMFSERRLALQPQCGGHLGAPPSWRHLTEKLLADAGWKPALPGITSRSKAVSSVLGDAWHRPYAKDGRSLLSIFFAATYSQTLRNAEIGAQRTGGFQ